MNKNLLGIIIDPGHGGIDPGAVTDNMYEKDYNLKISKYMYNRFKELQIPVYITREEDITLSPEERTNKILNAFGNNSNVIVISNHLNAGGGDGAEVIYALRNNSLLADLVLSNIGKTGQNIRSTYQKRLPNDNTKDYYFIHRNTGIIEPIIIEYGFIDNPNNVKFLNENYQNLAESVIKSVLEYKNILYTEPSTVETNNYLVQKGDTLYSISKKYGINVIELKKINNLTSNLLSVGQIIKVPSVEESNLYTVQSGDTLYSIAKNNGVSIEELKTKNNLTSDILSIGQILAIPSDSISEDTYTIKAGDSLYSIAKTFDTSVDEIKKINNLTSNLLSVGQKLIIPKIKDNTYIVQKGDTIYGIAKKYNITIDELKEVNNLISNLLSIDQVLIIPEANRKNTYTVKQGDTIYGLARNFNKTVDELKKINNLLTNIIIPGQILII